MAASSAPALSHLVPRSQSSQQQTQASRLLTPSTNPIPLLSVSHAQPIAYVYAGLIPLYYYVRRSALIRDPVTTLTYDMIPVAITTALFCATCLPSAGNWNSGTKDAGKIIEGTAAPKAGKGSVRKKGGKVLPLADRDGIGGSIKSRFMPTLFSLILTFALPPIPLFILAICLGAPLFPYSQLPLTLLLAVHVSILAFLPVFYTHGVSTSAWRDVSAAWLPFDEAGVWAASVGTFVGGWIGAIPIALDWDRDWQKWPCTVIWGLVMGWTVGRVLTNVLRLGVGVRIDMSETEEVPKDIQMELDKQKKSS